MTDKQQGKPQEQGKGEERRNTDIKCATILLKYIGDQKKVLEFCTEMVDNGFCMTDLSPLPSSIPTEEQKEEWISVKDRLPSDNEKVLVCKYNRQVKEASFLKKDQWDRLNQFIIGGAYYDIVKWITHWMPMPAPPNTASSAPPISQDEKLK